jgi:hypothetical protein
MQNIFSIVRAVGSILLSALTISACSNTQISTELPANHPANPAAEASAFVPPPNPFSADASVSEPARPRSDGGNSEHPQVGTIQQHDLHTMQPEEDAHENIPEKKPDHQH